MSLFGLGRGLCVFFRPQGCSLLITEGTSDGVQEETCESELVSLQTMPMTSPAVISSSNDQQESTIQQLNENNEYEPEDNNAG